jgi:hypothetical protein
VGEGVAEGVVEAVGVGVEVAEAPVDMVAVGVGVADKEGHTTLLTKLLTLSLTKMLPLEGSLTTPMGPFRAAPVPTPSL